MNQQDANEVIEQLTARLREIGLGWVADSAQQRIVLGRDIPRTEPVPVPGTNRKHKATVDTLTTVPLTPDEQVAVLVEAIHRSVIDVAAMEAAIALQFGVEAESVESIRDGTVAFVDTDSESDQDPVGFVVSPRGVPPDRQEAVESLLELLDQLVPRPDDAG